jgi:hypothetical protein
VHQDSSLKNRMTTLLFLPFVILSTLKCAINQNN